MSNITKQPDELSFIRTNNWLKIKPEEFAAPTVEYAGVMLDFENIQSGDYIDINGIRFTVSDQLDDVDTFLSLSNYAIPSLKEATVESFINAVNNNSILNTKYKAFAISEPGYVVMVQALYRGPAYNLTIDNQIVGVFFQPVDADVQYETDQYTGFGYEVEIYKSVSKFKDVSDLYESLVTKLYSESVDGEEAFYNISSYMQALTYLPIQGSYKFIENLNRYRAKIYMKYLNEFNVPQRSEITTSDYTWAIEGGVNAYRQLTEQPTSYYGFNNNKVFNTLYKHKVDRLQAKYLSFIYYHQLGTTVDFELMLEIKYRFIDGSTTVSYKPIAQPTLVSTDLDGVYHVDVSPTALSISTIEDTLDKEVVFYDIRVVVSNPQGKLPYTVYTRYELTEDCTTTNIELMWLNSLGGWDTFLFTGTNDKGISIDQERFKKPDVPDYDNTRFSNSVYRTGLTDTHSINSRYLKQEEIEWLKDLAASPYVFILQDGKEVPVLVDRFNYNYNSLEDIYSVGITLSDSYTKATIKG